MEFHDYIINYALQNDKDIQLKTSLRQEFFELKGEATEKVPKTGEFFKHQDLFTRYLRQYDRIFSIHETGTGKTGSIIDAAETFRKEFVGIERVVIIEPGKPTLDDFKSQIVKFFPEQYGDNVSKSDFLRKRNITKKVDKWYTLDTYESFSNKLTRMSLDEIELEFSDTMFFLDEAHRMRNYGDSDKQDDNIYVNLWKLLHTAKRTKIVVGTATPLVNSVNDFVPLLNLLLPSNYQLPLKNWDYSNITLNQIEPYLRGKISFVRSLDAGIKINYSGSKINYEHEYKRPVESKNTIPHITKRIDTKGNIIDSDEPIQKINAVNDVRFKSDIDITLLSSSLNGEKTLQYHSMTRARGTKQSFELSSRESSVFVYPDGSWGTEGFKKYIKLTDGVYKFKNDDIKNFLMKDNVLSMDNLFQLSSKFWFYVKKEVFASKQKNPGNSFCYLEFVSGSGVILLGLILELFGFENFTRQSSVFVNNKGERVMQKNFKQKKRFALITSKTENIDKILELFNSKENMNGEYLQIVIASKVARDGINLANVLRGYIMSPGWHESGMYQALSRFIRATSHKMLLEQNRDVDIDIFKLATCLDTDIFVRDSDIDEIRKSSIDVFNYIKSEEKDLYNHIVLKQMKNVAFDAVLNYQRNFRASDMEYTKQTDYGPKFPPIWCDKPKIYPSELIRNTKKLLYYQQNIEKLDNLIRQRLFSFKIVTIDDLVLFSSQNNIDDYYIYLYINTNLKKLKIYDNFGNSRKITIKGNALYLDNTTYHYTPNSVNELPMFQNTEVESIDKFYSDIANMDNKKLNEYIRNYIWKLDSKNKPILADIVPNQERIIQIIEDCVLNIRNGSTDPIKVKIYEMFIHYINRADYPHASVDEVNTAYGKISSKPGRSAKKYSSSKLTGFTFIKQDTGKDTVYYHFFNIVTETNNIVNIFRREDNKVRILKQNSNEFVDADVSELPIFQSYYKQDVRLWLSKYQQPLSDGESTYGTVFRDGKFRIIKPPFETSKGTVCGTNKEIPFQLLSTINLNTENLDMLYKIMNKHKEFIDETLEATKEHMEKDYLPRKFENVNILRTHYFWDKIMIKTPSREFCEYLKKYLEIKNKLLHTL
tara:strand:- start:456 stop:3767 length:3312 start_codon:yes stop_codon:yes gene_type:complete